VGRRSQGGSHSRARRGRYYEPWGRRNMNEANHSVDLSELATRKADEVRSLISEPTWRRFVKKPWRLPLDPEHRRLLRRLHKAIREAPSLPPRVARSCGGACDANPRRRARELLCSGDPRTLSRDGVAELVDAWDQLLIVYGPEDFVRGLLATEYVQDAKRGQRQTRWRDVFRKPLPEGDAKEAWAAIEKGECLGDRLWNMRMMLSALYSARAELYELNRSRRMVKARYLWHLVPILLMLIALLAWALATIDDGVSSDIVVTATLAGALGGAVSGTYKLRDHISGIGVMRAFLSAVVVQLLLGAAAGLFAITVIESGLIDLDWIGQDWARFTVLAFAAGFSEPFFLGLVSRVAAVGEDERARGGNNTGSAESPGHS
jgi:hypothetical protein